MNLGFSNILRNTTTKSEAFIPLKTIAYMLGSNPPATLNSIQFGPALCPILLTIRGPEDYNGAGDPNTLITPHLQYLGLSASSQERLNNYRGMIEEKFDE
jgi:hypothetical protein